MKVRSMRWIVKFIRNDDAVTAVEYAVLLSLIIMACIVAVGTLTTNVRDSFEDTSTKLGSAFTSAS
jgi:pilus assembly protein Flp/PilA